jgi:hypothetical protein
MVGGAAGGIPGAALGGAAGAGYRQLGAHLTELPGAAVDVDAEPRAATGGHTARGRGRGRAGCQRRRYRSGAPESL